MAFATLCLVLVNLDLLAAPLHLQWAPSRRAVHRWLTENPEPGAVVEYPFQDNAWAVIASLGYGRRVVNGLSYIWPPTMTLSEVDALSPRHVVQLWEHLHPRFVVLRAGLYPPAERATVMERVQAQSDALRLRAEFGGGDFVYELVDRGRGRVLRRYWPRERLAEGRGIDFEGVVTGVPEGALARLVVELNGHPVIDVEGIDATTPSRHHVPLEPELLVDGINVLELRGEYRLSPSAASRSIGETGHPLAADVEIGSGPDESFVRVNGRDFEVEKGYLLLVLDPASGEVTRRGEFNTSWYTDHAATLSRFVDALPDGARVVVASEFDVSRRLTDEAVGALRTLGLREDLRGAFGSAHAAVGVKGARPGSALEIRAPQQANLTFAASATPVVELSTLRLF